MCVFAEVFAAAPTPPTVKLSGLSGGGRKISESGLPGGGRKSEHAAKLCVDMLPREPRRGAQQELPDQQDKMIDQLFYWTFR